MAQGSSRSRGAAAVLFFSATLWGLAWWPLQNLAAAGLHGPALSTLCYGAAGLAGLPLLWRERRRWQQRRRLLLLIALFGGWGSASFVLALTSGDVVREMLLFYLAPAWSVLGGRFFLGEAVRPRRWLAVACALLGAYLVIRAGGPVSTSAITYADWLALSSGLTFAGNNLTTRAGADIPVTSKIVASMLACALLSGVVLALQGLSIPSVSGELVLGMLGFLLVWIVVGNATTSYGVTHLEAGRAALIILAELVAAVLSVSLINGRTPAALELAGGALILGAAALDGLES